MNLRGNLFIKIFVGFWLVTIAILGSWLLASNYFESLPPEATDRSHEHRGPPHRFMLRIIYSLQNEELENLAATVASIHQMHNVDIYLLDGTGSDLLGRPVSAAARRAADQLTSGRRRAFLSTPEGPLVAYDIYRRDVGPIRAVFMFQPREPGILDALGDNMWLRLGLAVLISGLLCFGLSRLMTNRLKDLQLASRRLATGDLDTRLRVRDHGGDETDELARDFNSMAEQLQERIQAQKRLLGDVSHELRSPLARLRIALALAQENRSDGRSYLQRIEQEAERLEELIGQLLSSQGQGTTLDRHIDLVALLQELCDDANFEAQSKEKTVLFKTGEQQALVESSGDLLRKGFENILRNALVHTVTQTQVKVVLKREPEGFSIAIEDQGPGVPEAELGNIFAEFYRVDTARTRESGGYGLGLAIARRAVEQHGGSIVAHNTGTGLRVTVQMPPA